MKTKLNFKILLLVSILLISMCIFNTNMVQATEVTADETTTVTEKTQETAQATTTTKSLKDLTEAELNNIIPNTIEINVTKTEYANYIVRTNFQTEEEDIVQKALEEKFIEIFNQNGITNVSSSDFLTGCDLGGGIGIIENGLFGIKGSNYGKEFTIKYAKESGYSEQDATYVKNAVKNIKFLNYEGTDAVFTMYNLGDEESASKWNENTYDFNKLLNDTSITIKGTTGVGGIGGGTPWGVGYILYFYKNNVIYDIKHIMNLGAYGVTLDNGTPVNMATLDKEYDKEIYAEMEKQLKDKGITNIIGAYELTAYGNTYNNMSISFNIGSKYNGKQVTVLHKKNDNTYETLTATVTDGKATITVNELSPFMLALSNTTNTNNTNNPTSNKKLDNEPKTGVADYTIFASIVALISLGGIVTLKFKK